MMTLDFHNVAKIEVTGSRAINSATNPNGVFNTREIIVTFDDGRTQQIDFYNRNDTLPLEIN